eukprot:CAMPEP_0201703408 /NCGR_PEP_ID=MMETSP0578-20130828/39624_1 /ASSEMBLY_ACC=CAM_ASM_000663 /TAXON_ID=267565 /ORGANISM="Skeletonema grethea, Strain CCMP 1804" /LENGTH=41 /DNA_ID= /DNA_START= /DNA_END= /DNA_ORIENTATION=
MIASDGLIDERDLHLASNHYVPVSLSSSTESETTSDDSDDD